MRKYNIPIFIPHRGCPHDCAFCNQRKITGVDTDITPKVVENQISEFLKTIDTENSTAEIAFFGGSFTGLELETQEAFLKVAGMFFPNVSGIRLSTRPDYINDDVIALLKKYNVTTVELGVQSSDDLVLQLNSRGHTFDDVIRASKLIKDSGIALGHQMMLGMYGSNPQKDMKTVDDIIALAPACVRIYPVVILKDTALEDLYNDGKYIPYSIMDAAELAKDVLCAFENKGIDVIRIGLHSSDELESDGNIISGPYHQAFGELVESLVFREKIEAEIKSRRLCNCELLYPCSKNQVSKVIGHKKMNKDYFKSKYNIELKCFNKGEAK
ncbi:MAG: radical SAM protein [Clostridia bacterium]|nr:radical SAM protein [Clostridia bacterium]